MTTPLPPAVINNTIATIGNINSLNPDANSVTYTAVTPGMYYSPRDTAPSVVTTYDPLTQTYSIRVGVSVTQEQLNIVGNYPSVSLESYLRAALREFATVEQFNTPTEPLPLPVPVPQALGRRKGRALTL